MLNKIFRFILLGAITLYIMLYYLCETTGGLKTVAILTVAFAPGKINMQGLRGNLSDFTIEKFSYTDEQDLVQASRAHVRWDPFDLLSHRLVITNMSIDQLDLRLHSSPSASSTPFRLSPLEDLALNVLEIDSVTFTLNSSPVYQLKQVSLKAVKEKTYILQAALLDGTLSGTMQLYNEPALRLHSSMQFSSINLGGLSSAATSSLNFTLNTDLMEGSRYPDLQLALTDLNGRLRQYPVQGQAAIALANNSLSISKTEIRIADSRALFSGSVNDDWNLEWEVNIPDLKIFMPDSHGRATSSGTIKGPRLHPQVTARFKTTDIRLPDVSIDNVEGNVSMPQFDRYQIVLHAVNVVAGDYRLPDMTFKAESRLDKTALINDLSVAAGPANQLSGQLVMMPGDHTGLFETKLNGALRFHTANLAFLDKLSTDIRHIKGDVSGKLSLSGTLAKPVITGEGSLKKGEATLTRLATQIRQIQLDGRYDNQTLAINGTFYAGKGKGSLQTALLFSPSFNLKAKLSGERLQLIQTKDYRINITPRLNLTYDTKRLELTGEILVPDADITPVDFSSTTTLTDDVVIVDAPKAPAMLPTDLSIQVHLALGNKVHLKYESLTAQLTGSIDIFQAPGQQPAATGQFQIVNGLYKSNGKILTIQNGRIIYTGNSIDNPGLDIRATQKIKTVGMITASQFNSNSGIQPAYTGTNIITIGMQINGTINKPQVTLFSVPAGMSQNDILSYLLFGYPQSQLSGNNKFTLLSAAASLKLGESPVGGITEKLQNLAGLTEFNVGSTEVFNPATNASENATTLSLGKQVTDKLSLRYSVGVYSPVSILSLRYQILKNLAIQSESSTLENGVDLLFGFERD